MIIALIHLHLALCPEFYIVARDKHFPSIKIAAINSAINIPRDGEEDSYANEEKGLQRVIPEYINRLFPIIK